MLKDVDPKCLNECVVKKHSLFLNCFLVTPNCHRVSEFRQHVVFDGRTRAFKKLVCFRGTANELSLRVLDSLRTSKIHSEKPSATDIAPNSTSGLKHIKELLLGKRSDHVFRMVIVGDPNVKLSEIGIPCHIAERLQVSKHLKSWNSEKLNTCCNLWILEKGESFVRRKDNLLRITSMDKLQIGDTVYRPLNDGDIVLINRPPSIHQHSFIALSVKELVALDKQLINGQSSRNLLSLSHDSLTAAHLVVVDGVVLNLHQMQQLQMFCPRQIQLPAIVKAPLKANPPNTCFWSGKQLFSLLLPPDFDYDFPSNDVRICNGELLSSTDGSSWLRDGEGSLLDCLVKHCQEKSLEFLHAAQEVLCEWLSMRGLSVSLSDLYLSSDSYSRENMIGEVSHALQEAERLSHTKLLMVDSNRDFLIGSEESMDAVDFGVERMCYEKQKSAALSQVSVSGFKQVFWDIQNLIYQYANTDNSLVAMLKAGSKGNLLKLDQHSMCLGLQHSLVPLSFRMPHQLSCAAWNDHKAPSSSHATRDNPACTKRFIPCAVVENSFLSGLNPLESHLVVVDGVVLNLHQMQQLQMFCPRQIQLPAIAKAPLKANPPNTCFWSGKQLFSLFLPPDFDYDFPSNDVRICNGELLSSSDGSSWLCDGEGSLLDCLVKHCQEKSLEFLHAAQEVLCEWLSMRGLSVSLSDLYLSSDSYSRENMIGEVSHALQEAERLSHTKLLMVDSNRDFLIGSEESMDAVDFGVERMCYEKQKSAALSQVSVSGFKQVFWDIQNLIYQYANTDNSLVAMLKAGSKGNLLKLDQHSMCLGLQHSLVPLSFRMPHQLSCAAWNDHKAPSSSHATRDNPACTKRFIPCAVVENSFLSGLNPLECFSHAVTTRDISFSDNADLPGTLNRRLMFFMGDLYLGYDGTVRNSYGNQLVQFSYSIEDNVSSNSTDGSFGDTTCGAMGSEPVASSRPVVNAKNASFSLKPSSSRRTCPWVCHFHISKEMTKRRRLNVRSIVDALYMQWNSTGTRSKTNIPKLQITSEVCSVADNKKENNATICITVTLVEGARNSGIQLDNLRDIVIPYLLGTVVKGFPEFKKVDILWKEFPNASKSRRSPGELYLRVFMSEECERKRFWSALVDSCLEIMDMIDWERSHPDDIHDLTSAYGIVVARQYFLTRLKFAISDTSKTILVEHLLLIVDCLSATGEFVALNAKGLADQRKHMSVSAPFTQACFSNPADCLIKAAKKGVLDNLQGSIDALSWGKMPSIGTGGRFDIIYSGKGHELAKPEDVNKLLGSHVSSHEQNVKVKVPGELNGMSDKWYPRPLRTNGDSFLKGHKSLNISKMIRSFISLKDVLKMSQALQCMLKSYPINHRLSEVDKSIAMMALYFHPRRNENMTIAAAFSW
ncbi:DNA-directed RNA polymerase IV subunit like [Actinidia chinensis var. chinensis]|uniref:DNA-directed RNA polymerase n=1 Tax=Actinidia chinensis var. chinensis TaxID=1590841 RepID=A0A2R6QK60_ACTCC|nr:DNA-directed RNA polymerase IV subunit like [Actinidia chinensis var. chinensis]